MKNLFGKLDISDALMIGGSLLFSFGLWKVWPPAAYLFLGAEMGILGYFGGK